MLLFRIGDRAVNFDQVQYFEVSDDDVHAHLRDDRVLVFAGADGEYLTSIIDGLHYAGVTDLSAKLPKNDLPR